MKQDSPFHFVTVGWDRALIERLWRGVEACELTRISHILHPRLTQHDWTDVPSRSGFHYFRRDAHERMPSPDREFLASLEQEDIPTIHNMILGDRVVSALEVEEAYAYATFLARRLGDLYEALRPSVIIGGFDSLHAGLSLAVARRMKIPWVALNYCVIPPGIACFCDRQTPAARVQLAPHLDNDALRALAKQSLEGFESRRMQPHAYVAPAPPSFAGQIGRLPQRMTALIRTVRDSRQRDFLRFTDSPGRYSVGAAVRRIRRTAAAHKVVSTARALEIPPAGKYVLFALHMQPESSIDVWAPFFSNQMWVIETLSRAIPPSCKLLVKIHKSDVANYSAAQLDRMRMFPGVELVRPFADARSFVEKAALVVAIQGTIGLEAALLGKPVIVLAESPMTVFPSVTRIGNITDLPALVRRKLGEAPPRRDEIIDAYAAYLSPFLPAGHNDWTAEGQEPEAGNYAALFAALRHHIADRRD